MMISRQNREGMQWCCRDTVFSFERPLIMGIINLTPDSFSDGGKILGVDAAVARAEILLEEGADILDIGGESTRPMASLVSEAEEIDRVLPTIEALVNTQAVISVDTRKPAIMRAALKAGVSIINDVNGFRTPEAINAVKNENCGLVVMHMKGEPQSMQQSPKYNDVVSEVSSFFEERLDQFKSEQLDEERVCFDPGIGFGKETEHNMSLLHSLANLSPTRPIMVGVSRKSLLAKLTGKDIQAHCRDAMSAVAVALLCNRGGHIFRVHDVSMTQDALKIAVAINEECDEK